jgi:hypothetical protein
MKKFLKKNLPRTVQVKLRKLRSFYWGYGKFKVSTGMSDNQKYPDFCVKASNNSKIFNDFRRKGIYHEILEHVDFDFGELYLDEIEKKNGLLLTDIESFKQNDTWGNPNVFEYKGIGKISPSTLRYIKVYGDLISFFESLDGMKICEIGVGYGGQCRIINSASNPSSYTLVDIKPALMLTQTYLDKFSLNSVLKYKTMNELENDHFDLLISNYAFTELPRHIQDIYLKKIILNSKRGYITYNDICPKDFNSYKKEELLTTIPNSRMVEEKPLTHKNNCIIVWGD